jgi:hypothetical protein
MKCWTGDRIPMAGDAADGWSRRAFLRKMGGTVAAASVGALGLLPPRRAEAGTVQRPLSDFLSTQGTFCLPDGMGGCLLLFPPVPLYLGWGGTAGPGGPVAWVDFTGVANRWAGGAFGTQINGTVTERSLSDGRAQVDVTMQTTQAFTFVTPFGPAVPPPPPLLFGHYAPDVLAGQDGAFATCSFHISFINTAPGAPLPDFLQLFLVPASGQETVVIAFQATAQGTLRSAFGVPDGTPGTLTVAQTGNLPKRSNIQASILNLRPTGR